MYQRYVKRILDFILSLAATIVLAIPMGIIALWIKADSPGPVFFKQRRVGKGKTHFNILKFRTMRGDTPHDVPTHLLKNADSYITKSGRVPAQDQPGRTAPDLQHPGRADEHHRARAPRCITSTT